MPSTTSSFKRLTMLSALLLLAILAAGLWLPGRERASLQAAAGQRPPPAPEPDFGRAR
ncbi:MAG: hypothetical protein ACI8S6_001960 [Myxococcota bacterium]|jgi:hypothetical protein